MRTAVLIAWLATIAGGLVMLTIWLTKGGLRQVSDDAVDGHVAGSRDRPETRLRPWQLTLHATVALAGFLLFVLFVDKQELEGTGYNSAPWIILGLLAVVAAVGISMAVPWAAERKRRKNDQEPTPKPAEQHIPAVVAAAHGLAALATVVLVLIVAIG